MSPVFFFKRATLFSTIQGQAKPRVVELLVLNVEGYALERGRWGHCDSSAMKPRASHSSCLAVQVGLLIEIGKGRLPAGIVKTILLTEDRRELAKVSPVAPAHGLYLMSVAYDDKLMEPAPNAPPASFGRWLRYPVCTCA